MKKIMIMLSLFFATSVAIASADVEKIILIRHAEKSPQGLGQLTCQGLNRALLLPAFFKKNFPPANAIFVPNPAFKVAETDNNNALYYYLRPLTTIQPTAIALNLPVDVSIGYTQDNRLVSKLLEKKYHSSTIYVVWEHLNLMKITQLFFTAFQQHQAVPVWSDKDFNQVFVLTIDWKKHPATLHFQTMSENIDHLSKTCPTH